MPSPLGPQSNNGLPPLLWGAIGEPIPGRGGMPPLLWGAIGEPIPGCGGMPPLLWGAIGEPIGEPIAGRAMPPGGAMPGEAPMPTPPLVCGAAP